MSDLRRVGEQLRADLKVFARNPAAMFFTAILPIVFMVLFVSIFGNGTDKKLHVKISTLQVPGFIALAVTSASFLGLAIGLVRAREDGVLKRVRGTPVPSWVVFAGRVGVAIFTAFGVSLLLLLIGKVLYGVDIKLSRVPALLLTLAVGATALSAVGIFYSSVIPTFDAAPAMTNAVVLPLYFISGVFIPTSQLSHGLAQVASVFPIKPLNDCLIACFNPLSTYPWGKLAVLAAWGVGGLVLAVRTFSWVPRRDAE
ncbi:MAG: ABC transporter permease [Solirubrobacteraceae bacterium]